MRALERLLFFNQNQKVVTDAVVNAIEKFGRPYIELTNGRLWVSLDSGVEAQSLFVIRRVDDLEQLVGGVVYTRQEDALVILFIVVREDYSSRGLNAGACLTMRIIDEVWGIARRIKGIACVSLFAPQQTMINISVDAAGCRGS